MTVKICLLLFVAHLSRAYSQIFSTPPSQSFQQFCNPCYDPCSNPCSYGTPFSPCTCPQVVTTVVDNSVSNALANALQLLIVSNLIEKTMSCQQGSTVIEETPCDDNQVTEVITYDVPCSSCGSVLDALSPGLTDGCSSDGCGLSPCVAEALFPASIPAQLICNFGYVPKPTPCFSFNVEPTAVVDSCQCGCNTY